MIADLDILRAANLLIKQHGGSASIAATRRAAELLKAGDAGGHTSQKIVLLGGRVDSDSFR